MDFGGKNGLIVGVANKRSIAWSCAQALHAQGMRLAFSYVNERLEKPVRRLAEELDGSVCFRCDVTKEEEITSLFQSVGEHFGGLDTFVHAVAFAKREELAGSFFDTSKDGYMLFNHRSAIETTWTASLPESLAARLGLRGPTAATRVDALVLALFALALFGATALFQKRL